MGCVHARLHRQEGLGVDGLLRALILELHGVWELPVAQARLVLLPRVVIAGLVDQSHVDLGL